MLVRILAAATAIFIGLATAQPAFQLTVDSIMRGPALVGYEPRQVRWSGNGDRIWFEWKLATDPVLSDPDIYEVMRDGSGLRKLTREQRKLIPPASGGHTTTDRRMTTWSSDGDIYVYDHHTGQARRLSSTKEQETNPHLTRDGKRVAFTRANNLFVLSLENSTITQLTDIQPHNAPVPADEKKGTASQEYLK